MINPPPQPRLVHHRSSVHLQKFAIDPPFQQSARAYGHIPDNRPPQPLMAEKPPTRASYSDLPDLPPPPAARQPTPIGRNRSPAPPSSDEPPFDYSQYLPTSYIPPSLSSSAIDFFRRLPALPTALTPTALGPESPRYENSSMRNGAQSLNTSLYSTTRPHHRVPPRNPKSPVRRSFSSPISLSPPPLSPIHLTGYRPATVPSHRLLTPQLSEEIRLLIPPRYQIHSAWSLLYATSQDGTALSTLYKRSLESLDRDRPFAGYVLVVRDTKGDVFGAYLTDAPRVRKGYFGSGECFLWQACVLPDLRPGATLPRRPGDLMDQSQEEAEAELLRSLPPPPSAEGVEKSMERSTTFVSPIRQDFGLDDAALHPSTSNRSNGVPNGGTGTHTPSERIRFRAFPYSGVNDFMIHCDAAYLSVGGGDGVYGLWLNELLDRGISQRCPSFGNEPLSEEGEGFGVLGVELWGLSED